MHSCPCCSNQLLRHARRGRVYWFCSTCKQEMPDLTEMLFNRQQHFPSRLRSPESSASATL